MKRFKKFGTALLSCMMLTASFATVSNMTMITVEAHPGRTDAQGGHHDYKNKSGLGSYHYHCGDHEAHLHPNGVCPYKNGAVSNENTSGQTQTQTQTQSAGNQNQVTEQMNTYQPVFDANYYYMNNPDLQSVVGSDSQKLFEHFYTCGMAEGRRASENFDVSVYKANNPDLVAVFGDDLKAYYTHYVQSGQLENRVCKKIGDGRENHALVSQRQLHGFFSPHPSKSTPARKKQSAIPDLPYTPAPSESS